MMIYIHIKNTTPWRYWNGPSPTGASDCPLPPYHRQGSEQSEQVPAGKASYKRSLFWTGPNPDFRLQIIPVRNRLLQIRCVRLQVRLQAQLQIIFES